MKIDNLRTGEIHLAANHSIRLTAARGVLVRCTAGTLWITVSGEATDIFLTPGQAWRIPRNGLCLIESLGEGQLNLKKNSQTPAIKAKLAGFRHFWQKLGSYCRPGFGIGR